jgi:hypothetical protein
MMLIFFAFDPIYAFDLKKGYDIDEIEQIIRKEGQKGEQRLINQIYRYGVNFYLDDQSLISLVRSRVGERVIMAIREARHPSETVSLSFSPLGFFKPLKGYLGSDFLSGTKGGIGDSWRLAIEYRRNNHLPVLLDWEYSYIFDITSIDGDFWVTPDIRQVGDYDVWIFTPGLKLTTPVLSPRNASVSLLPRAALLLGIGFYDTSGYRSNDISYQRRSLGSTIGLELTLLKLRYSQKYGILFKVDADYHHFGKSKVKEIRQGISMNGYLALALWR